MPRLGDYIGALLADAAQARVLADLEAVKIADLYSRHELLKHLAVPRFRLPDITVDFPVLVADVEGLTGENSGRSFEPPTSAEITEAVAAAVSRSDIQLPRVALNKVAKVAGQRATELFEQRPQLLSPTQVAGELTAIVVDAVKAAMDADAHPEQLQSLETSTRRAFTDLLSSKLVQSPSLQVSVTSEEIKAYANTDGVIRIRLTITEDSYEVVSRDDGQGYFLVPE